MSADHTRHPAANGPRTRSAPAAVTPSTAWASSAPWCTSGSRPTRSADTCSPSSKHWCGPRFWSTRRSSDSTADQVPGSSRTGRKDQTRHAVNSRPELALAQVGDPADETAREGSGMVHIHGEIVINRPPEEVFDVVADTTKEPRVQPAQPLIGHAHALDGPTPHARPRSRRNPGCVGPGTWNRTAPSGDSRALDNVRLGRHGPLWPDPSG